jgi:hypothetical protein
MSVSLALPGFINWNYVADHLRSYNNLPCDVSINHDDLLYRIGSHVDALTPEDCELINCKQKGYLSAEQRYRVLNWLACLDEIEIKGDLALLIFGREQLTQWLEKSQQAYPDYEFYLVFEFHPQYQSGWESGINFSMHWTPKPGAPEPSVECDFPWKLYWEAGEMFWNDWMPNGNQFDFALSCYPSQESFATPGAFCVEGDLYTTQRFEEADLMSVSQALQHFQ